MSILSIPRAAPTDVAGGRPVMPGRPTLGRPMPSRAERPPSWPPGPVPPPSPVPPPGPVPTPWPPSVPEPGRRGVGFAIPGSAIALDLEDRLLDRRIVLLSGPLDRDCATRAAARLMLLDADAADPVEVHLSCPDGDLESAVMIAQTIDLMRAPVTAIILSTLGGPAVAVAAAAQRRLAHADCRIVLQEPRAGAASGVSDELAAAAEQHTRFVEQMCAWLAQATGRPSADVIADVRRGRVLTAKEALEFGLVNEIVPPKK